MRKRSSCASGSRYVPACSTGFCVAMTRNGTPHRTRHRVDRDLALLHHFEQRRLGLGARTVDLVGEHDVGEDRPGVELEGAGLLVVDRDAGDVARQQVGRELDAGIRALHRWASARASDVLPVPGTSSSSTWPSLSIAVSTRSMTWRLPSTAPSMLSASRPNVCGEPGGLFVRDRHAASFWGEDVAVAATVCSAMDAGGHGSHRRRGRRVGRLGVQLPPNVPDAAFSTQP